MAKYQVKLNSVEKAKEFCTLASKQDFDIDLMLGRYTVDAKSIMGIFSLDLSKPIDCVLHTESLTDEFKTEFSQYIA